MKSSKTNKTKKEYSEPFTPADHTWSIDEIQEVLDGVSPLVLNGYEHKRKKCSEFLEDFLNKLNREYSTRYVTGDVQCQAGRARSITDMYRIMRSYYPNTITVPIFAKILKKLRDESKITSNICNDVKRRVFSYSANGGYTVHTGKDEFGLTIDEFLQLAEKK